MKMNSLFKYFWTHIKRWSFSLFFFVIYANPSESIIFPKPTGPYSVGTTAIELLDPSRHMLRDSHTRRWMVQAFYPCEPHDQLFAYMPNTLKNGHVQGIKVLTHARPQAIPFSNLNTPLIIFIPGFGEERQKYTILCEECASQGYTVLSLDQPYVTNYVKFLDGTTIVLAFKDAWNTPRDRNYRYRFYDEAMDATICDIQYILNHLNDIAHQITTTFNKKHIILMGHSFGGNVAHTFGFQDERVTAVVDIDSKITERKIFGRIGVPPNPQSKPVLFIRGIMQYQEDVGNQLTKIAHATIWKPQVQHSAFSDQAYLSAKINGFGQDGFWTSTINWLLKKGPHWSKIDTNLSKKNADAWVKEYRDQVITWLKINTRI